MENRRTRDLLISFEIASDNILHSTKTRYYKKQTEDSIRIYLGNQQRGDDERTLQTMLCTHSSNIVGLSQQTEAETVENSNLNSVVAACC